MNKKENKMINRINCPCEKCIDALKKSVESMKEEHMPEFCIQDYINEIQQVAL